MAAKYVLSYFGMPGRAEPFRMMFALAGVEFTDNHVAQADWPALKSDASKFPLGFMPTLDVDGEVISQSRAVNRFLAEEFDLYGSSNMERAMCDQVNECTVDLTEALFKIMFSGKTQDEQKVAFKEYFESDGFKKIVNFIASKVKGPFLLGDKPSCADMSLLAIHQYLEACGAPIDHQPKELVELAAAAAELEGVKKYLACRKHGWQG